MNLRSHSQRGRARSLLNRTSLLDGKDAERGGMTVKLVLAGLRNQPLIAILLDRNRNIAVSLVAKRTIVLDALEAIDPI